MNNRGLHIFYLLIHILESVQFGRHLYIIIAKMDTSKT